MLAADLGYRAWSNRPYVVTGYAASHEGDLTVEYTLPQGGRGKWQGTRFFSDDFWCWDKAEIGKRIPNCLGANWKVRTASGLP